MNDRPVPTGAIEADPSGSASAASNDVDLDDYAECPVCDDLRLVVEVDDVPSMLGYGRDVAVMLACGHSICSTPLGGER